MPKLFFDTTGVTIYVHDNDTGHYIPANTYTTNTMNGAAIAHLQTTLNNNRFHVVERWEVENHGAFAARVHFYDVFLTGPRTTKEKAPK